MIEIADAIIEWYFQGRKGRDYYRNDKVFKALQ